MADLTPIKVRIGLKNERLGVSHDYPNFGSLACCSGTDWAVWLTHHASGWFYDKACGHADEKPDSPCGTWLGVILVPDEFATQAVAAFPDKVEIINEAALATFYEQRITHNQPSLRYSVEVLQALAAKKTLGLALTAEENDFLDPATQTAGISANSTKTWAGMKAASGYTLRADLRA